MAAYPKNEPAVEDEGTQDGEYMCACQGSEVTKGPTGQKPEEQDEPRGPNRSVESPHDEERDTLVTDQPKQRPGNPEHPCGRAKLLVMRPESIQTHRRPG
ncbi:hypothetical protein MPRG_21340 [Mycobacterium paragordonae]|uniref:Uncharacterized protein n=1 Tax=Mycobacterium paragordonae TaxID=1389713 RepID=A0ABQ1C4D0_9MYCO|nr:hypothetical protein MPRG_21340 [Mycobacterium paragordonae]